MTTEQYRAIIRTIKNASDEILNSDSTIQRTRGETLLGEAILALPIEFWDNIPLSPKQADTGFIYAIWEKN
jgi:hypothetical protein